MINPISVINYNGSTDTVAMLDSLVNSDESFDVIIVDNDSSQKNELKTIADYVCKKYGVKSEFLEYVTDRTTNGYIIKLNKEKIITLIQGNDNYGFSIGTNIGLNYAINNYPNAQYLTILNNDTIVTPGFLSRVIEGINKNKLAAAMGTILYYGYEKPYIWSIGGPIDYIKAQGIHVDKDSEFIPDRYDKYFVERQFISGCFTVFKREPLIEIGLLDEDYFFAGEEYQYSVDLTKKYRIGWIPSSVIYHKSVKGVGNGSSHTISNLKWQYNAYMVKIVFMNKNKNYPYLFFWHLLFKAYVSTKLKRKFLTNPEYGMISYTLLRNELFKNINNTKFVKNDFDDFVIKISLLLEDI